jgi:phosphoglycolate phosphatase
MNSPPPLLVFDLDGTLVDTAGDLVGTLNYILTKERIPPLPLETARPMLGAGARALIECGLSAAGRSVSPARLEEMFLAFLARYEAHIADESRAFPGAEAALDRFEAAGWAFAVCTNKFEHPSVRLLTELGLAARFRAICGQNTFPFCKPDPRALIASISATPTGTSRNVRRIASSRISTSCGTQCSRWRLSPPEHALTRRRRTS